MYRKVKVKDEYIGICSWTLVYQDKEIYYKLLHAHYEFG